MRYGHAMVARLSFDCPTCGQPPQRPPRPLWATAAAAVDCVTWLPLPSSPFALRDVCPVPGEAVRLRVRHPFAATRGDLTHVVYQPVGAALDGFAEHPADLAHAAVVTLRVDGWTRQGDAALLEAIVEAVTSFGDLPADVPDMPTITTPLEIPCHPAGSATRLRVDGLEYVEGSAQGDLGGWVVLRGDVLWLYARWGFHDDIAWVGPARLSSAARAALDRLWVRQRRG